MEDSIQIKGARVNNLKNIDLEIPRGKLVVITGLSGSGKSSLAFDTLYVEGQRRYVATDVKPTEDPSMNQPTASANSRAYADDARAFGKY